MLRVDTLLMTFSTFERERTMNNDDDEKDTLMSEEEAAKVIGVSKRTLQRWRCKGIGPVYRQITKKCIRYRRGDLVEFLSGKIIVLGHYKPY